MTYAFYYSSAQSYEEITKKYCDPSLSVEKVKELENCDNKVPEEVCNKSIFFNT
jgi:hypothetical protein